MTISTLKKAAFLLFTLTLLMSQTTGQFSADSLTTIKARGQEKTILRGNAYLKTGETEIHADLIELYGPDNRYALCTGNVEVNDETKGIHLTSSKLFYDSTLEIMRVEGQSEMIDQKNEVVVRGGFLEDFGPEEITIIQIGVRLFKDDMICRSEYARYDRKNETLELSGMPVVYRGSDKFQATRILINLKTDEITLEGNVSGSISSAEEETVVPDEAAEELSPKEYESVTEEFRSED